MKHICKVCGFDGEFELENIYTQIDTETSDVDTSENGKTYTKEVVSNIYLNKEVLNVCPCCRIVYKYKQII